MKFNSSITSSFKTNNKTYYLLLVVLLIGIILRVYGLSEQTYWYDEMITLEVVEGSPDSIISGSRPPLYLVLAHFWIGNFGTSEDVARILSIIFGVASIVMIYIVGKSLFNQKVGLLSAFFMSVSQFQIYYSQELRYYSLYQLLTLISFFFYLRLLNSKSYINTALYILSTVLLYYCHDFGVLIIAVQNLYIFINFKSRKSIIPKWILSQFIVLLCIAPRFINIFIIKAVGEGGPNWVHPSGIWSPLKTILSYMGLRVSSFNSSTALYIAIIFLFAATALYLLFIAKDKRLNLLSNTVAVLKNSWKLQSETILVLLWLFVPITLLLIMSEIFKPMYVYRYLICSAPALYILVALFLTKLNKVIPILIVLITYAILISPGLYFYYTKPARNDWREVGSYIKEKDKDRESVVLISKQSLPSFKRYNKGNYEYCALPKRNTDLSTIFSTCELDDIDHFWLVLNRMQINNSLEPYYSHKDSLYHIVREMRFVVSYKKFAVILYSFEKVKE